MRHDPAKEKQQARELIDRLPPTQLSAVVGLLEAMLDRVEEEEITPETAAALDRPAPPSIEEKVFRMRKFYANSASINDR